MDMITLAMAKAYTDSKAIPVNVEEVPGEVLGSGTLTDGWFTGVGHLGLVTGETYFVTFDGVAEKGVYNGTYIETSVGGCVDDSEDDWYALGFNGYSTIAVYTVATAHTVDPNYIPAMDSITLIGANGNPYKLTVDESGALAVTAV